MNATESRPRHLRREPSEIVERLNSLNQAQVQSGAKEVVLWYTLPYNEALRSTPNFPIGIFPTEKQWSVVRYADLKRVAHAYLTVGTQEAVRHHWLTTFHTDALEEFAWLMGRDDVVYEMSTKDSTVGKLHAFAIHMGGRFTKSWIEMTDRDPRVERMAAGLPCEPGCGECGR